MDVPESPYGHDRLAYLLRMLRPAPARWITRAQLIAFESTALTDRDLAELEWKLESDARFRDLFDADPIAAAETNGMQQLARALEHEIRGLIALAERVADAGYRATLEADPLAALHAEGMPAMTAEPLLRALAVGDETMAKLPEVVAHEYEPLSQAVRLRILLLGSTAVVDAIRARANSI
jgi:hypothetical protein